MKLRRLPPLHVLEAFEVAARELSFRKAVEALHLTPRRRHMSLHITISAICRPVLR
jgi:hypothetical protein